MYNICYNCYVVVYKCYYCYEESLLYSLNCKYITEGVLMIWTLVYAYLGLVVGYILSKISPEEMKSGKKYFRYVQAVIMLAMAFTALFFLGKFDGYILIATVIGIIASYIRINPYLVFGFVFGYAKDTFSIAMGSMVFIFGMLEYGIKLKKRILFTNLLYFIIPFFIVVLFNLGRCCNDVSSVALLFGYSLGYAYKLVLSK